MKFFIVKFEFALQLFFFFCHRTKLALIVFIGVELISKAKFAQLSIYYCYYLKLRTFFGLTQFVLH